MKNILYKVAYITAYGFWYVMSLLPFCVLYFIADILYILVAYVVKYRYKVIVNNLKSSFPDKNATEIRQLVHGFYHWFCDYLVETIKLMTMSPDQLRKRMKINNAEEINKYLDNGRSVAVYLGHYCNWEWMTSLPYWIPSHVQCCELYHPLENEYFDKLFKYVREQQNALCIPMQESLRKILDFKHKNAAIVVGYIADQVPMWNNIHHWVNFLHHDTPVLTGAERIIKHTDQVVFYGDYRRVKRGYYECEFILITDEPKQTSEFEITDIYFELLEKTIQRDPIPYLWSHNRWKRTREEFDKYWEVKDGKVLRKQNVTN